MGAPKKADWREERRMRAWKLKEEGWQQKDIAVALGGSSRAVSQWLKRGRAGVRQCLLSEPGALTSGDHPSQRTLAAQTGGDSELYDAMWLPDLASGEGTSLVSGVVRWCSAGRTGLRGHAQARQRR